MSKHAVPRKNFARLWQQRIGRIIRWRISRDISERWGGWRR